MLGNLIESDIVCSGRHYQYQLESIFVLPVMIFNYVKRKHVEKLLAKVNEFDESMAKMNWTSLRTAHSRFHHYLAMGLVVSSILLLSLFQLLFMGAFLASKRGALEVVWAFVFLSVTELYLLVSFQFVLRTGCIYSRFSALNMNVR